MIEYRHGNSRESWKKLTEQVKSPKESRENERQEVLEMSRFPHLLWSMRLNKGNGKEIELVKETQKGMLKRNRTWGGAVIETRGSQNSKENARLQNYMLAKKVFFDV